MTLTRKTPLKPGTLRGLKQSDMPAGLTMRKPMRSTGPKVTLARRAAQGMPCMIRVPGVCNGDPATVVLCHYRIGAYDGMGLKPDDSIAAWGCSACHDFVDGRTRRPAFVTRAEVRLMHAEGVMRTQMARKGVA